MQLTSKLLIGLTLGLSAASASAFGFNSNSWDSPWDMNWGNNDYYDRGPWNGGPWGGGPWRGSRRGGGPWNWDTNDAPWNWNTNDAPWNWGGNRYYRSNPYGGRQYRRGYRPRYQNNPYYGGYPYDAPVTPVEPSQPQQ